MLTLGKPSKPIFLVNHWETFHKKKCGNTTPHQTPPPAPPPPPFLSRSLCPLCMCVNNLDFFWAPPPLLQNIREAFPKYFLTWIEKKCQIVDPLWPPPPWHDPFCTCTPVQPSLLCTVLYYCTVVLCTSVQRVRDQLWSVSLDNGSQTLS